MIEQGPYRLRVQLIQDSGAQKLQAPQNGEMARVIKESPACTVRIHFMVGKITLFDVTRDNASFEFCVQELARRSQTNAAPPFARRSLIKQQKKAAGGQKALRPP